MQCLLLATLLSAPVLLQAEQGFAGTADEASIEALNTTGENAKILSVSEQDDFFKVKVLVEGKVKIIKVPKPDGA